MQSACSESLKPRLQTSLHIHQRLDLFCPTHLLAYQPSSQDRSPHNQTPHPPAHHTTTQNPDKRPPHHPTTRPNTPPTPTHIFPHAPLKKPPPRTSPTNHKKIKQPHPINPARRERASPP